MEGGHGWHAPFLDTSNTAGRLKNILGVAKGIVEEYGNILLSISEEGVNYPTLKADEN